MQHADVFNHLTLARLLALIARKGASPVYFDSHADVGLHDLAGDQACCAGK